MLHLFACICDPHGLVCILYIISAHYVEVTAEDDVGGFFLVGMEGGGGLPQSPAYMIHIVSCTLFLTSYTFCGRCC